VRLDVSRKELENFQGRLRCYINEVSSPHLRSLHILDVPNEILVKIFEFVDKIEVRVDLERLKAWEYVKLSVETSLEVAGKARAILASCRQYPLAASDDEDNDDGDDSHYTFPEKAHKEYHRLYNEQVSMRGFGRFAHIVSSAMARMSRALRLEFHNTDFDALRGSSLIIPRGDVYNTIYQVKLEPTTRYHVKKQGLEPGLYEAIPKVQGAVRSTGGHGLIASKSNRLL
jgi:hypothetical protein